MTYGSIDEAVKIIASFPNPYLAKTDIANAFRMIPIQLTECPLLCFSWKNCIYMDLAMPMGCASSSQTFQAFSDALVLVAQNKFGVGPVVCVLDDFLFIEDSEEKCLGSLNRFQEMCKLLQVPLRPDKTVPPCKSLCFLGVELDVEAKELRLPLEKIERARTAISNLIPCKKAQLRRVQSCIGLLNFACVAVPLGRPFLRRLSDLCIGVRRPSHKVSINKAARLDLRAWLLFLKKFNCRSMLDGRRWHQDAGIVLHTDASGNVGFGAVCSSDWLHGSWPQQLRSAEICLKELAAVVIAVCAWRERFRHRCVIIRSDNTAVVACINAQTSRSPAIMQWLRHLFITIVLNNISVRAIHIPGRSNQAADALSRGLVQVFRQLCPAAQPVPTDWQWPEFVTRTQSTRC